VKWRRLTRALLPAIACLGLESAPCAQGAVDRESLRGLSGVFLLVEEFPAQVAEQGLSRQRVQAAMEEKLKGLGIAVLPKEAWLNTPGTPMLYANVNVNPEKTQNRCACSIGLSLAQRVILERDGSVKILARTWQMGTVGLLADSGLAAIQDQLALLVDQFASDFLAVNPKGEPVIKSPPQETSETKAEPAKAEQATPPSGKSGEKGRRR
jgi:hypothetical protein